MIVKYRNLKDVKLEWETLYAITPNISPFLKYENMVIAWKYFYPYYIKERSQPKIAQFIESGETIALAPLTIRRGRARLFGAPNGFNESGVLFKEADCLSICFELLRRQFESIEFIKIDERSPLASFRPQDCMVKTNVAIYFGNDYDSYFKTLTSSVRQNIRTSYNRMVKDNHSLELRAFINTTNMSECVGGGVKHCLSMK